MVCRYSAPSSPPAVLSKHGPCRAATAWGQEYFQIYVSLVGNNKKVAWLWTRFVPCTGAFGSRDKAVATASK